MTRRARALWPSGPPIRAPGWVATRAGASLTGRPAVPVFQRQWPGLSRPSTRRRPEDAAGISVAGKAYKHRAFHPRSSPAYAQAPGRRTTWVAGTSPAMTPSGPPAACLTPIPGLPIHNAVRARIPVAAASFRPRDGIGTSHNWHAWTVLFGSTERTRAMNMWNACMKLRRKSAVPSSVTSPSSVMRPGVNRI